LLLDAAGIHLFAARRGAGFDLFIGKNPSIEFVQLFVQDRGGVLPALTGEEASAGKSALSPGNSDYGGQVWFLMDTASEYIEDLGDVFYIYIPAEVKVNPDPPSGPLLTLPVEEGFVFIIRAFSLQYEGTFYYYQDIKLTIRRNQTLVEEAPPPPAGPVFVPRRTLALTGGAAFFNPGPDGRLTDDVILQMRLEPIINLSFSQEASGTMWYTVSFERDPILLNRLFATGSLGAGIFTLEGGVFLGILNPGADRLNPGITGRVRVLIPPQNRLSASFRFDTSFAKYLSGSGAYIQEYQEGGIEYRFSPQLTAALTLTHREFISRAEANTVYNNGWMRYELAGVYSGRRWSAGLAAGYQELRWSYTTFWDARYQYWNIYAGVRGGYELPGNVDLTGGIELPVYPVGYFEDMLQPFLVKGTLGVRWTF
jgi:hypothetical protein